MKEIFNPSNQDKPAMSSHTPQVIPLHQAQQAQQTAYRIYDNLFTIVERIKCEHYISVMPILHQTNTLYATLGALLQSIEMQ